MSNQHTPGPWMRTHGSGRYYIKTDKHSIATVFSSNGEFGCPTNPTSEQASANARLIAAAPELLEALRNLELGANTVEACYTRNPGNFASALRDLREYSELARAAIAKATGGAA